MITERGCLEITVLAALNSVAERENRIVQRNRFRGWCSTFYWPR
jgi:hypothetical protein